MKRRCLVFGCGYLGLRVARRWRDAGHQVTAVTRSVNKAAQLQSEGLHTCLADLLQAGALADLPPADWVLYAVGYDRDSRQGRREVYVEGLRSALGALPQLPEKLLYVSSTGVYAQNDGSWVDEHSPTQPRREGGQAALEAEQLLESHPMGQRAVILRMAGLYGPGRTPRAESLRRGEPIPADPDTFLNLLHVDDAASAVIEAAERAQPPARYVVADGSPTTRREYYEFLANLLGAPPPTFSAPAEGRGSGETNKRVDARRFRREFGWTPRYASFREGLADCVESAAP